MQLGIQRHRAGEVRSKRFFHDDPGPVDEIGFSQQPYGRQGCTWWHAQIMQTTAVDAQRLLGLFDRRLEKVSPRGQGHVVQGLREGSPVGLLHLSVGELIKRTACDRAEAIGVEFIQRDADDPAARDKPRTRQVE
jgi:hypothetical protein